jgi:hypothetical protein
MGDSIAMTVRSRTKGAPRVRLARSEAVPPGAVSVLLSGAEVVVSYGAGAVVDAGGLLEPSGGALAMPALILTAGDLELAFTGAPPPPAADSSRDFEGMWRRASSAALDEGATEVCASLAVREAEWEPADDHSPTRLLPLVELPGAPSPRAERTNPSARSASALSRERRRVVVRRVALVAMLLCAFALAMHARRLRTHSAALAEGPRAAAVAERAARLTGDRRPAIEPAAIAVPRDAPPEGIARPRPTLLAAGSGSKARAAADALSNGAYPEALALYEELAAEGQANPAYARVIEILRARADARGGRNR